MVKLRIGIFLTIFFSIPCWATPLMVSPAHGEKIDLSQRTLLLKWNENVPGEAYDLDLYFKRQPKPSRTIRVTGNSYKLKLKKIPPSLYWRVRPVENQANSSPRLFQIHMYEKSHLTISAFAGQMQSNIALKSDSVDEKAKVAGPVLELHADYSPAKWKNKYSLALHARNAMLKQGGDELNEQRFGAEFGWHLRSGLSSTHTLYVGYHFINKLEFTFDSSLSADYDVNFMTFRYFYRKPFSDKWEMEFGGGIQLPFPYTFTPSVVLKPLLGYRLNLNWRLDVFALYERYVSEPESGTGSDKVDITIQNTGAGLGVTYRL